MIYEVIKYMVASKIVLLFPYFFLLYPSVFFLNLDDIFLKH